MKVKLVSDRTRAGLVEKLNNLENEVLVLVNDISKVGLSYEAIITVEELEVMTSQENFDSEESVTEELTSEDEENFSDEPEEDSLE